MFELSRGTWWIWEFPPPPTWGFPKMVVPNNYCFFLLKMIILGCFGGTTIQGNTHMLPRHTLPACTFFDAATTSFWGTRKCHSSPRILPQLLFCSYKVGPLLAINEGKTKPLYKCPYEWVNGGMLWLTSCSSCYGKPHLIHECMVYIYIYICLQFI